MFNDFSVDYNPIKIPTLFIPYIHKYFMVKNDIILNIWVY